MERSSSPKPFNLLSSGTVKELNEKIANIGKPSIFIGSSTESIKVAEKIKQHFPKDQFQVDIWSDGIFGQTPSTEGKNDQVKAVLTNMEWLKNFTDIYDFAIFIFVPEDKIKSITRLDMEGGKPREAAATRHNVIFEFGMFLGKIGAKKSFILYDEETTDFIKLFFTDLKQNLDDTKKNIEFNTEFRMELYRYKGNYAAYQEDRENVLPYDNESIEKAIKKIQEQIVKNFKDIQIDFLPATTLAIGYFNNFIDIFVKNTNILKSNDAFPDNWNSQEITNEQLDKFRAIIQKATKIKLKIVIPTSIEGARQEKFIPDFDRKKFSHVSFPGKNRSITLLRKVNTASKDDDEYIIYDVPTTLNSSIDAIELLTPHRDIRELLKEKELRNFKKSLEYKKNLARGIPATANVYDLIEFITYDQFKEETL